MKLPLSNARWMRQLMRISTDVLGKLPSRDDGVLTTAIKCLAVYDSICKFVGTRGEGSLPAFIAAIGGEESMANPHFVHLFFSTAVGDGFKVSRAPYDEHTNVVVAEGAGGSMFFVEWRWGAVPDRSETVWFTRGFNFANVMNYVWDQFGQAIHVDFKETRNGLSACYGEVCREDFELSGASATRFEKFISRHREYERDGVTRTYLFVGPQGVGKTTFALRAARVLGGRILRLNARGLSELRADELNFLLSNLRPKFFVVDDLDKVDVSASMPKLLQVLAELKAKHPKLVTFLTANKATFDSSMTRPGRVDEIIEFSAPDEKERMELLIKFTGSKQKPALRTLAKASDGLTAAYLKEIALQLSYRSLSEVAELVKRMTDACSNAASSNEKKSDEPPTLENTKMVRKVKGQV